MQNLYIELADNPDKREKGLMYRKMLAKNHGMLFKFPQSTNLNFWMKNTYIPLDIAFLDDNGKILQIEEMIPLSTKTTSSNNRCKYALEVNHGWFKNNNIRVGNIIGGHGISGLKSKSQSLPNMTLEGTPQNEQGQPMQDVQPQPDVVLNLSNKEKLQNADLKGQDMILIYKKKDGYILPPKVISPPFEFEQDSDHRHDSIVKAWDNQEGSWKSFLIENIISLEEKK